MATTTQQRKSDTPIPAHELEKYRDHDATLDYMLKHHMKLTRNAYIIMAYGGHPKHWSAEREAELPEPFQHVEHDD